MSFNPLYQRAVTRRGRVKYCYRGSLQSVSLLSVRELVCVLHLQLTSVWTAHIAGAGGLRGQVATVLDSSGPALGQPCARDMLSVITKMHVLVSWGSVAQGVQIWTVRAKDVVWEFRVGKNPKRGCSVWLALVRGRVFYQQRVGDMVSVATCWLVGRTGQVSAVLLRG